MEQEDQIDVSMTGVESLERDQGVTDTPTANSDGAWMMGLQETGYKLGARSDEARNLGNWKRRDEELKKLGTTQEQEDREIFIVHKEM